MKIKSFLIQMIHDRSLRKASMKYLHGRLIDIGCGTKPYQKMLKPYIEEHIGLDHEECQHDHSYIDIFGSAYDIPSDNDSFDTAICTAVLEHLEEPQIALKECYRILKPQGIAIYTVPFIWHLHEEPRDFYRYSKYGLTYLFEKTGFKVIELHALSGFWVTFGQLLVYNIYRFNIGPFRWFFIIDFIALIFQGIAFLLDTIDRTEQWTWMYLIVGQKE
jgi:SAM-dependent methyltransferase